MRKFCLVAIAALVIYGCSKKREPNQGAAPEAAPNPAETVNAPPQAAPLASPQEPAKGQTAMSATPLQGTVDPYLTSLLKQFITEKRRLPASFLELAGAKAESVPRPPAGYTYAIDAATTQVKLVKR